jgi:N-acetylneuraminate synthase
MEQFDPILYKISSASLTDFDLLQNIKQLNKPIILSTGMSTIEEIEETVEFLDNNNLLIAQSTSTYPCDPRELNLRVIQTYMELFPTIPIGYSGHETGLAPTIAAVGMGATFIERHLTLDRAMWGTDQAASVEVGGMFKLVKDIRDIEKALGDGKKKVYESEISSQNKLRRTLSEKRIAI